LQRKQPAAWINSTGTLLVANATTGRALASAAESGWCNTAESSWIASVTLSSPSTIVRFDAISEAQG
jgi:hypothetical protein